MKMKITFIALSLFYCFFAYAQYVPPFTHCATSANTFGSYTEIDHPAVNNNSTISLWVQKVRVDDNGTIINNPHYVGVKYNPITDRWIIYNEDPGYNIPENSCYIIKVAYPSDPNSWVHKAQVGVLLSGTTNTSVINHPSVNDNASARCMWTRFQDIDEIPNNNPCELWYSYGSPGEWYISTLPVQSMPTDCSFNVLSNPSDFAIYEHESTFSNIDSQVTAIDNYAYWTILDHVLLNNDPNALLFVTHRREPSTTFIYRSFSVFYNSVTGFWELHIELENYVSGFSFPINNFFDVFIYDSSLTVDEVAQNEEVKIFPNPSNSIVNINSKSVISDVIIYNMLGQEVQHIVDNNTNELQIDVSHFSIGTYFAKIVMGGKLETVKLVVNN